ncbi:MAG: hypothetical protein ACRD17_07930, partial [Terriglobales bacterium]
AESTQVRLITLPHGGGAWPGGGYQPESQFGKTSQALDGSNVIWTFLASLPHRAATAPESSPPARRK